MPNIPPQNTQFNELIKEIRISNKKQSDFNQLLAYGTSILALTGLIDLSIKFGIKINTIGGLIIVGGISTIMILVVMLFVVKIFGVFNKGYRYYEK